MEHSAEVNRLPWTAVAELDQNPKKRVRDGALRALGVVEICNDNCPGQL